MPAARCTWPCTSRKACVGSISGVSTGSSGAKRTRLAVARTSACCAAFSVSKGGTSKSKAAVMAGSEAKRDREAEARSPDDVGAVARRNATAVSSQWPDAPDAPMPVSLRT
jgi:hypothetical protein